MTVSPHDALAEAVEAVRDALAEITWTLRQGIADGSENAAVISSALALLAALRAGSGDSWQPREGNALDLLIAAGSGDSEPTDAGSNDAGYWPRTSSPHDETLREGLEDIRYRANEGASDSAARLDIAQIAASLLARLAAARPDTTKDGA